VTDDKSLSGVYRYTDSMVAVMNASNMLIMLVALEIECQSLIKTELGLVWLRLWSVWCECL
jgi:hypothetical protein